MPKSLKTNQSSWTKVFRRLVQQVETDPGIRRIIGVQNIRSWKGEAGDKNPFAPAASSPVVRLTPQPRAVEWYSPDTQMGMLNVVAELAVPSLCIDDVVDLWDVLVQALRPGNGTLAQELLALGAETGEIVFSDPALDPRPGADPEGFFLAVGQFRLRVARMVNP